MTAIETLISVLCGPEGKCCISGSDDDRRLIDSALAELAQATAAKQPDSENLRKALQFYADSEHFIKADGDAWDTVSGEPQNYWCDESGTATVEDGHIARLALSGHPVRFEDDAAQPAAQQGVTYAELPEPDIAVGNDGRARIYTCKDIVGEPYYTAGQLRAFADATHTLRASHGQAPAQAASSAVLKAIREANMQLVRTGDDAFMLVPYKAVTAQAAESVTAPGAGVVAGRFMDEAAERRSAQEGYENRIKRVSERNPRDEGMYSLGWWDRAWKAAAPTPAAQAADSVQEDAARLDWLESTKQRGHYCGVFSGKLLTRASIDAARGAAEAQAAKQQEQLI